LEPVRSAKLVNKLVEDQEQNRERIGELGYRYRTPWAVASVVTRGLEPGTQVILARPDLAWWQRLLFPFVLHGRRRVVLPFLQYALTWPESLFGCCYVFTMAALAGATGPDTVGGAVVIGEWFRGRTYRWAGLVRGEEPDLRELVAQIRDWPSGVQMPEAEWTRLFQLAKWSSEWHKWAMNKAFVPAMVDILRGIAHNTAIDPISATAHRDDLIDFAHERVNRGPAEVLEAIQELLRDNKQPTDLIGMLTTNHVLAYKVQNLIDEARRSGQLN
jgi:hypothetical protein